MKTYKSLLAIVAMTLVFWSCGDELTKTMLKADVAPNELQATTSDSYVLVSDNKANDLETFHWTATDYGFQASVTYTLQIAAAGTSFAAPIDVFSTSTALEATIKTGDFNTLLLGLGLVPEQAGDIDVRVVSRVNSSIAPVYSNTRTISVTDYATSFPPIWGMGAGLKGWGPWPDNAVEWQSTEYKKYSTTAFITQGQGFRWFAQLDWNPVSYNYPFFTTVDPLFENANDGDLNLQLTGATGWYKVDIDLAAKTVVAVAVDEPVMFMMGDGLNGWGPWHDKEVKMTYIKPGVFVAQAAFVPGAFRFFQQADWGPVAYNFPYFTTVDAKFTNAADGDSNLKYSDAPATLKVTVDINAKTVMVGDTPDPVLYMMGGGLKGWGPWPDNEIAMTYDGNNTFSATTDFTQDGIFRFFAQEDYNPTSYNFPYFTTVDTDFVVNPADGDNNFKYTGATGSRTIHVDMTNKTVTLD